MAHYAFLNSDNVVTEVISGRDENEIVDGISDWETYYGNFRNQVCKRTSYNTYGSQHLNGGTPFRGNYASIGGVYDEEHDVFIPQRLYSSWTLNTTTWLWEPPTPYPTDGKLYGWFEDSCQWIEIVPPVKEPTE